MSTAGILEPGDSFGFPLPGPENLSPHLSLVKDGNVLPFPKPAPWTRVNDALVGYGRSSKEQQVQARKELFGDTAFALPVIAPGVLPKGVDGKRHVGGKSVLAQDSQVLEISAWGAQQAYAGAFYNGVQFMGYTALSELAQISEYRRIVEITASELTRKWIYLKGGTKERIEELKAELVRLDLQGCMRKTAELDGNFGRGHIYIDTGATDNTEELKTRLTVGLKGDKGFLKALRPVEPVWCYPAKYDSNDPLKSDWYNPQTWFCMGKEIHKSRFLTFVGRPVPDMLKPSYAFGGMSLTQMAKPYVDNWLRTRQAVADLVWSFSVCGLETDLSTIAAEGGDELLKRAALFANLRTNQGLMLIQKDSEEFFNVSVPLAGLHELQSQAQEHQCSVVGIPVVKLLGVQPAGLNASSEGELTTWYDWCMAFKEKFFAADLDVIIPMAQVNIWGEVDPSITWDFEPMRELTEEQLATVNGTKATTAKTLIEAGILNPEEDRKRLSSDPESGYEGIAVDDVPEDPALQDGLLGGPDLSTAMGQLGVRSPEAEQERTAGRDPEERREPRAGGAARRDEEPDAGVQGGGVRRREDRLKERGQSSGGRARAPREFAS